MPRLSRHVLIGALATTLPLAAVVAGVLVLGGGSSTEDQAARRAQAALSRPSVAAHAPVAPAQAPVTTRVRSEAAKRARRILLDAGPTGVAYGGGHLWVTRDDGTVARLHPRTAHLQRPTRVGRFPVRLAVGRSAAWVVDEDAATLTQLDLRTGARLRSVKLCDMPSGVAAAATAVWVVCATGELERVDAATARVTSRTTPGPAALDPADVATDASGVWVTGRDRVMRIDPATARVTATVAVPSPSDVAVGAGAVWVADFDADTVTRIDPRTGAVTGSFRVGRNPSGVAVSRDRVWVLNNGDSTVTELHPASGQRVATISIGPNSYDIAAGGGAVWAQSYGARSLFRITVRRRHDEVVRVPARPAARRGAGAV